MTGRADTSIHYRRRWYYALWATLLVLAGTALALWERPASVVQASLVVKLQVRDAPPGTRVRAWFGPRVRWRGMEAGGPCLVEAELLPDGSATLPLVRIRIARRRWVKDYIPRLTWDLAMIQLIPPEGPPRYVGLPFSTDIRIGLLRPGWRLTNTFSAPWRTLRTDATAPDRLT